MELKVIKAEIVKGTGKNGKPYTAVDVFFACELKAGFSKRVFLDSRDKQILNVE
jgi:hypothetical protein